MFFNLNSLNLMSITYHTKNLKKFATGVAQNNNE